MLKWFNKKKKDNKGFTLVELIIVVAILAILVGLLAPQYTKYVEKSRKAADISNMDEMINAVKVYAADSNEMSAKQNVGITMTKDDVIVNDTDIINALKEFCPDYENIKLKSAKWGTDVTATITISTDGAVTVTYSPEAFAEEAGLAKTPQSSNP